MLILPSLLGLIGLTSAPLFSASDDHSAPEHASRARVDAAIGADELEAHVRYLASDELGGRYTGSVGGELAASYLARTLAELEAHGLQPAGDLLADGTTRGYLQDIGLDGVTFAELPSLSLDGGAALVYGADFALKSGMGVRAGFDVLVCNDPAAVPTEADAGTALYLDLNSRQRQEVLVGMGLEWQRGWGALLIEGRMRAAKPIADPSSIRRVKGIDQPLILQINGAAKKALESGEVERIELAVGGSLKKASNVVALLPGKRSDTDAPREALVISAHYDHLRPREMGPGQDGIFNGADDDASGVAAVLEIIEAMALGAERPERDLVVLLATGEEIGLLGTSYYLEHPVVPLEETICNLNFEMLGRPDALVGGPGKLWLTGYEHTNLGADLTALGLPIAPDPRLEQHFFERSDNYAFVLKGIVGQSFSSYDLHTDYHKVTDEADTLDYEHMRLAVNGCAQAVRLVSSTSFLPTWAEGYQLPRR